MSKTLFTINIGEPRVRKKRPKPTTAMRDKSRYSRKAKHKKGWDENPGPSFLATNPSMDAFIESEKVYLLKPEDLAS